MEKFKGSVNSFPFTLIFVRSIKDTVEVASWLIKNGPQAFKKRIVNYHANLGGSESFRAEFLEEFVKDDSSESYPYSILVATTALGQVYHII